MAIKILKKGTKKRITYIVECPECGCQFEYNKEDISKDIIAGTWPTMYNSYVYCPQCNNSVSHTKDTAISPYTK